MKEKIINLKMKIESELNKNIDILKQVNQLPQEDRNLADSISIIMVKDNLIKLIDYINDKLD